MRRITKLLAATAIAAAITLFAMSRAGAFREPVDNSTVSTLTEATLDEGFESTGDYDTACAGPSTRYDVEGIQTCVQITDAAPDNIRLTARSASPIAASNQTGANVVLKPGTGTHKGLVTAANFVNNTTTITIPLNGAATVGTEGTAFECNTVTDAVCATNIATWLDGLTGVSACAGAGCTLFTGVAGSFYVWPEPTEGAKSIGTLSTITAAAVTFTNGTEGNIALTFGPATMSFAVLNGGTNAGAIRLDAGSGGFFFAASPTSVATRNLSANRIDAVSSYGSTTTMSMGFDPNSVTYGNGNSLTPTTGTMTGNTVGYVRSFWIPFAWTNAMVAALTGTADDVTVGTLKAKSLVKRAMVVITGAATGTTTLTVAVGRTGATYIDYVVASDAQAAANTVYGDATAEMGSNLYNGTGMIDDLPSFTATTAIKAHFISTGANLSAVTGSSGNVYVEIEAMP